MHQNYCINCITPILLQFQHENGHIFLIYMQSFRGTVMYIYLLPRQVRRIQEATEIILLETLSYQIRTSLHISQEWLQFLNFCHQSMFHSAKIYVIII